MLSFQSRFEKQCCLGLLIISGFIVQQIRYLDIRLIKLICIQTQLSSNTKTTAQAHLSTAVRTLSESCSTQ